MKTLNNIRDLTSSGTTTSRAKAILFDCDGVLCPPLKFAALLESEYQITREMTAGFFKGVFESCLLGKSEVLSELPPYLIQWNWNESAERFLALWLSSEREVRSELLVLINELRKEGYYVGLATNQESHRAKYMRTVMEFNKIFDQCFISCELGFMKPQPEYYIKVTKQIGVSPQEIIFIDDQQPYLDAALDHGWHGVLYTDVNEVRDQLYVLLGKTSTKL